MIHERIQDEQAAEDAAWEAAAPQRAEQARLVRDRQRQTRDRELQQQQASIDRALAEARRIQTKMVAEQRALAAKPGVKIGMTPSEVIDRSNWGRPKSVNRTTTASGTREQWVYGVGNYLYFENGRLTAIQN